MPSVGSRRLSMLIGAGGSFTPWTIRNARSLPNSPELSAATMRAGRACSSWGPWPLKKTASISGLVFSD